MGKPKSQIDWELFEKLVWVPVLTVEHMADMLNTSKRTLERRAKIKYKMQIAAIREQKSGPMRHRLFTSMWTAAMSGNISAQIWLSKNILGWSDKLEQKQEAQVSGDITWKTKWGSTIETSGDKNEN